MINLTVITQYSCNPDFADANELILLVAVKQAAFGHPIYLICFLPPCICQSIGATLLISAAKWWDVVDVLWQMYVRIISYTTDIEVASYGIWDLGPNWHKCCSLMGPSHSRRKRRPTIYTIIKDGVILLSKLKATKTYGNKTLHAKKNHPGIIEGRWKQKLPKWRYIQNSCLLRCQLNCT